MDLCAEFLQRFVAQFGNEAGGVGDHAWFTGFSTVGYGGEVGGVGFDQDVIFGNLPGDLLQITGTFKGDDS